MAYKPSRREVVIGAGVLTIAFSLAGLLPPVVAQTGLPGSLGKTPALDAWLRIDAGGGVTVFTGKVELGQGIATALAQIAADELDVDMARIDMITGDTALTPDEGYTFGSLSIQQSGMAIRFAAAHARQILIARAARRLGATPDSLRVEDGLVFAGKESVSYWQLAEEGLFERDAGGGAAPKPADERRYAGRPIQRRDIPSRVFGQQSFLQDIRLPGMLHGRIVRPPGSGAVLAAIDEDRISAMPGVKNIVRDGSFLGVIARGEFQAIQAAEALAGVARWSNQARSSSSQELPELLTSLPARSSVIAEKDRGARLVAAKKISARYTRPFQAHASLAPSAAIAQFDGNQLTVWSHCQGVFPLRKALAQALRMDTENIRVIHAPAAGCYGQNGADDAALDAALLARAAGGRPVRLQWMRGDEFRWEPFGSAMVIDISGAVTGDGRLADWQCAVKGFTHSSRPGDGAGNLIAARHMANPITPPPARNIPRPTGGLDRNAVPPYQSDRLKVMKHFIAEGPLRTGALRSLGSYANVFAIESFMDELAALAGIDPVAFRLKHLGDTRGRAVIEEAASRADWGSPMTAGHGRGIGYSRYKNLGGYLAVVAQVAVDADSGEIRVMRAVAAADCGEIINPDGTRNQIEGGIVQSTSWTLMEEVSFDSGGATLSDWLSYPILTFDQVPLVDVHLMCQGPKRTTKKPLGAGELAQGPMAAAIGNALYDAVGVRLRDLPLTPEKVRAALQEKGEG
ncbi:MAG: xanthine dehydrogenase family protein molybdopterin-binding subunit [Proteobacteria bacterium]|nr:xanthine dehydrogenase family protein molybdopterin-binding subunit [Pseudomonadota bacterium]